MAIQKSITTFVNNIESIYVSVLEKVINEQIEEQIAPLSQDISNFITERMRFIRQNGGLLFMPYEFTSNDKFSSLIYNNLMYAIKIDLETVLVQLSEVVDLANVADTVNQIDFTENIAFANNNKAKIRNLKTLFDSNKEFNGYRSNAFIKDDNTYEDDEFATTFSNGMHKLTPFVDDIIANEENDASVTAVVMNDGIFERQNVGDVFSPRLLDGKFVSTFSTLPASFVGTINGELTDYPGLVIAYRVELSDIQQVNNISFSYFSNGEIDVLALLYTDTNIIGLSSQQWQTVDNLFTDSGNFGSIEYNFDTISAKEIVIIIGQKFVSGKEASVTDDEMNKYLREYNLQNTLENNIGKLQMIDDITDNSQLNIIKRDRVVYNLPSSVNRLDTKLARMYKEFTKKIYGNIERLNDFGGFVYSIDLFNLRIKRLQYKQFSIYESDTIVQKGSLINTRIAKTERIPDGTWINYYILYGNHKIRTIEKGDTVKDIITVDELGMKTFETDFLIDAKQPAAIVVLKNGTEIIDYELDLINADVAKGITLDVEPKFNDVLVVQYPLPAKDDFAIPYKPWNVNILDREGKPNIKDNNLLNITNVNRALIITSGSTCAYAISNRFKYDTTADKRLYYIHKDDVYTPQIANFVDLQSDEDVEANFKLYDLIEGVNPSGNMYKVPQFTTVSGEVTRYVPNIKKDIYYGIVDEDIIDEVQPMVLSAEEVYETEHDYMPGTLKVKVVSADEISVRNIDIQEYSNTTPAENFDKNIFTINTSKFEIDDNITVSYVPIDIATNPEAVSNVLEFNDLERFDQTVNGILRLGKYPYIDTAIIAQSLGENAEWHSQNNVYSLKDSVSVRYVPMEVKLNGERAMRNVTNYATGDKADFTLPEFIFDITKKNYAYYVDGDVLVFNTDLVGSIEVKYFTLNDRIKLRAELYRFNMKRYDITPELYDILVLTNTI